MDDLIAFCVEQIALDGDRGDFSPPPYSARLIITKGTTLGRLWEFALAFKESHVSIESGSREIDEAFRKRLWKYLLKHDEVILKDGDQILHSNDSQLDGREDVLRLSFLGPNLFLEFKGWF